MYALYVFVVIVLFDSFVISLIMNRVFTVRLLHFTELYRQKQKRHLYG